MKLRPATEDDWEWIHICSCGFKSNNEKALKAHLEEFETHFKHTRWSNHHREIKLHLTSIQTNKGMMILIEDPKGTV